jgi:hypothetical protein
MGRRKRFITSAEYGYGNEGYQPPSAIVTQIRNEFLSPEGKEIAMQKVYNSIKSYQAETQWIKDNQPRPSR